MAQSVTGIVYQHDGILVIHDKERDFYSVVSQRDLSVGTLVLLEYPVSGDEKTLMGALVVDPGLKDELYPRTEVVDAVARKVANNLFSFTPDLVLGRVMSKFNHSCTPNCHVMIADHYDSHKVYGVWLHRNVTQGEELTLDYVNHGSVEYHDKMKEQHGFVCTCTEKYILDNDKRGDIHVNMSSTFRERNLEFIEEKVNAYFGSRGRGRAVHNAQRNARKLAKKIRIIGV